MVGMGYGTIPATTGVHYAKMVYGLRINVLVKQLRRRKALFETTILQDPERAAQTRKALRHSALLAVRVSYTYICYTRDD